MWLIDGNKLKENLRALAGFQSNDLISLDARDIFDKKELVIDINVENQPVFLSLDIKNKKPAFLNVFIKNTGKDSEIRGHILMENFDNLTCNITAHHQSPDTTILSVSILYLKHTVFNLLYAYLHPMSSSG